MKIYKVKLSQALSVPIVLIPLLLVVVYTSDTLTPNEFWSITGFFCIGLFFTMFLLSSRIEVGENNIKSYIAGFGRLNIHSTDVTKITYGNLFKGGLGYGKGLILTLSKNRRTVSISEKLYGKEAIEHIRQVLNKK